MASEQCKMLIAALNKLTYMSDGRYYVGMKEDVDVTKIVEPALKEVKRDKATINLVLASGVQDKILDVAGLYNDVNTSDLQGIAMVEAANIIDIVKNSVAEQAIDAQRTVSQFATSAECKAYNQALSDLAKSIKLG